MVPRRGVFLLHHQGRPVVGDPNTALLFGMGDIYQISHPADGGDRCTVFVFPPELVEDAFGSAAGRHMTLDAAARLYIHLLTRAMAASLADQLEAEEGALVALARHGESACLRVSELQRRRVEEVRALLASQPADPWRLDAIARAVYCSPFHLARQFRAITGESVARYLLRLRLALALDRLARGETELARLAVDLGFAHHSHFSARFRSVFGTTPAAVRTMLTSRDLRQLSKIVTAGPRPRR